MVHLEGRESDSPYVDMVWRGHTEEDCKPICPADGGWNMHILRECGKTRVAVEGSRSKATMLSHAEGAEWITINFKVGVFMPHLPVYALLDGRQTLPESVRKRYWLDDATWQFPDYDDVELFIAKLVREGVLVRDPVVTSALADEPQSLSIRSVRRRFLQATGLSQRYIRRIERAKLAMTRLEQGDPILDVVYEVGYADQSHLTRALKHFMGMTPAQISHRSKV